MTDHISSNSSPLRPALWLLFFLSVTANAITSGIGATLVSVLFGVIALSCAVSLVVHHYRHRE
ncbi:hypothetical protein [Nucisporomicrobium flavum]|uniref:hypothetical protein n=1 Tax=Nucisporomicrobium flavum TaxID=2785915 RepID=UPI0018F34B76|nr:hypothetical protein [Nucisporomicrobium flavum]